MESSYDIARFDTLIHRVLDVQDITIGNPQRDYIVRYRGRLLGDDTQAAYSQLAEQLAPFQVTPLFRWDDDRHAVILVPARPRPSASNSWVNLVLFLLTLLSVTFTYGYFSGTSELPTNPLAAFGVIMSQGWQFSISLMAILVTHEFGHYLMGRRHGVHVTLPYFIPLPLPPLGTMGAVINMKELPKNRRQLLDIGLAGPLAGLIVAIPILALGLSLSSLDAIPASIQQGTAIQIEGNSVLYLLMKFAAFGQLLPAPVSYGSLPEWLYWLRYFFTGQPYPLGGVDVFLHPVALAGWAGILLTSLNLIPAGQLDGGHLIYVLVGRKGAQRLRPLILLVIAALGFFWFGWWIWVALIFFLGRVYAEPLDQITPLDGRRRALAILGMIIFLLVFTPIPMNVISSM